MEAEWRRFEESSSGEIGNIRYSHRIGARSPGVADSRIFLLGDRIIAAPVAALWS